MLELNLTCSSNSVPIYMPDAPTGKDMIPDQKDLTILHAMARLGTNSSDKIHAETDIPKSTVHYRIKRLQEEGIVDNVQLNIDRESLGLSLTVVSEVLAEYQEGYHEQVGNKLAALNGVNQVYFVMGDTDFIVISYLPTHDKVKDLIEGYEAIDEVQRTSSKFVIQTVKSGGSVVLDWDTDVLMSALGIDAEEPIETADGDD